MPRIVIAFDGSPPARVALQRAGALFPGAQVTIVSVAQGVGALASASGAGRAALPDDVIRTAVARLRESTLDRAREIAEAACRDAADVGLLAEPEIVAAERSVWSEILRAAGRADADAIVCGTRGHGMAVRAVIGSVAAGLVGHAELPVLVVPEEARAASGPVLIAFDGSDSAGRGLEGAGGLFAGRATLVLHVWRSQWRHTLTGAALLHAPLQEMREIAGMFADDEAESAQATADAGVALAREHGLNAHPRTVESNDPVAQTIMRVAEEVDARVTVVGRRGHGAVAGALFGSTSSSLVHASSGPVLVAQP
jgi:nucleotide-binding universal stress UspA family protein